MSNLLQDKYEATAINKITVIAAESYEITALERFKTVYEQAQAMAKQGQIRIKKTHTEKKTGFEYIDAFMFERLA